MAHGKWWAITSFLFLASLAFAQVPTPIRSVSTLPATCKGGSSTQSSDMVVLIVAGVGTNYLCTATNTWTAVLGGSGSPPGGSLGSTQFNATSTVFGGTPGELDASAFAGADICAQVNAAIAALPADGGSIKIPTGNYSACAASITISKGNVALKGMGKGNSGTTAGATILNFADGVTGIAITGGFVQVSDMFLISANVAAGANDGISNKGVHTILQRLAIRKFGASGVLTQGQPPDNADSWHYDDIDSSFNFGDGYLWASPCSDNNLGVGTLLSSSANQGWGFNVLCGGGNLFQNPLVQSNVTGGYHVGFPWNTFYNAYAESGTGSSFVIDALVSGTRVWFNAFGLPTTITNTGATAIGNEIHYVGVDGWNVQNNLLLSGQPASAGNKTYLWGVGLNSASELNLLDLTDGADILDYSPITSAWTFPKKVHFTAGTTGTGGFATEDNQTGTTYTIPSSDAGALVSVLNSNPVSWDGPALADNITFWFHNIGSGTVTYTPNSGTVNGNFTAIIPPGWWGQHFTDNVNSSLLMSPTPDAFPDCQDVTGNHLNFTAGTGIFTCGSSGGGGGSVTHTGTLDAGKMVIGNGVDDVTIDSNVTADGSGNVTLLSVQTTGLNGGFTGIEGTGAGLTAGATIDLLYPDSTNHCWHTNLNNVDHGCTLTAAPAGTGSFFGIAAVTNINQSTQTPWALALTNSVATAASAGGLGMYVTDVGDAIVSENTLAGVVTASFTMRQNGEFLIDGNGAAGDPALVEFSIPNTATADFIFNNGSPVTTGSPRIRIKGKSSGEGIISVAAAAGTPNPILLPTATATSSGQVLQSDAANPQQTSWVTDIKSYNHSGTLQTVSHLVQDSCVLGTSCAVTLTSTAVYTNSTSYTCACVDDTAIAACSVAQSSGSAFTITGTGTDTIRYICVGN